MAFLCYYDNGDTMFSNSLVCDIIEYINRNINKEITIDELANRFYYDKTYIMKRFKKEIIIDPCCYFDYEKQELDDYINTIRILNSLDYYKYDNYILSIALKNGFNSIEYYSEIFKKIMGVNPLKYRKFVNRDFDITDNDIDSIIKNTNDCNNLKLFIDDYLSRMHIAMHLKPPT